MSQGKLKTKHGAPRVIAGTLGICRDSKMCMGSLTGIMDGNDFDKHPHSFLVEGQSGRYSSQSSLEQGDIPI